MSYNVAMTSSIKLCFLQKLNPFHWVMFYMKRIFFGDFFESMFPRYVARSRDGGLAAGSMFYAFITVILITAIVDTIFVITGGVTITGFFVTFGEALGCSLVGIALGFLIICGLEQFLGHPKQLL